MQLAVLGGHTEVVQELADKFPLSLKFTTQVRSQLFKHHIFLSVSVTQIPTINIYVCSYVYSTQHGGFMLNGIAYSRAYVM